MINNFIDNVLEHKTVALRAAYGMGKTFGGLTPLVQYFKQLGLSQVTFSEKVSLCYEFKHNFSFKSYQDIEFEGKIVKHNIVVQLDSIHRIQCNYDILYLDEYKELLTSFENPTLRSKLNLTFAVMRKLIQNAKYIIVSDADLDDFSLDIFESYFNRPVTKIDYTFKNLADRKVIMNTDSYVNS